MASQTRNPTVLASDGSGIVAWTNPQDAVTCAGAQYGFAVYGAFTFGTSDFLTGITCNFAIPVGSVINGVEVAYLRHAGAADVFDSFIQLITGGAIGGINHATFVNWPLAVDAVLTVGSPVDLWGLALTDAIVNANDFGSALAIDNTLGGASGFVGCISQTVHFTPPPSGGSRGWLLRGTD